MKNLYKQGWFFTEKQVVRPRIGGRGLSIPGAIDRQERIENIFRILPGRECGACGSPDCRTLAEDVVEGRAALENCVFLKEKGRAET